MQCWGCSKPYDCEGQTLKFCLLLLSFECYLESGNALFVFFLISVCLLHQYFIECLVGLTYNQVITNKLIGLYWSTGKAFALHNQYRLPLKQLFSKHDWGPFWLTHPVYSFFLIVLCSYSCWCSLSYSKITRFLSLFLSFFQVCSDINKPNGQFILPNDREAVLTFVSTLPIRKVIPFFTLLYNY